MNSLEIIAFLGMNSMFACIGSVQLAPTFLSHTSWKRVSETPVSCCHGLIVPSLDRDAVVESTTSDYMSVFCARRALSY